MPKRQPITYADARDDLPQSAFAKRLRDLRIARTFEAANSNTPSKAFAKALAEAPQHPAHTLAHMDERSMVERESPHPAPRPTPDFAADVDAAIFDARWEAERRRARPDPEPQPGEQIMSDTPKNPPVETLREGPLKAALWRNESERGAYHSVTLARTYKDRDGQIQDTSSFRAKDMLGLSELARRAHHHTHDLDRTAFKEQRQAQEEQARSQKPDHTR